MSRRVVVTGLGVASPLGNTVSETWSNLLAGKSGVGAITLFDPKDCPVQFAAEVKNFDITKMPATNDWLGLTCAACHTSELRFKGKAVRVDGGAAHISGAGLHTAAGIQDDHDEQRGIGFFDAGFLRQVDVFPADNDSCIVPAAVCRHRATFIISEREVQT